MQNAFKRFVAARVAGQLFINVSPDSIYEEANFGTRFLGYARDAGLSPDRIVIELTEESQAKTVLRLADALEDHDDVEAVYANFDIPDAVLEAVTA